MTTYATYIIQTQQRRLFVRAVRFHPNRLINRAAQIDMRVHMGVLGRLISRLQNPGQNSMTHTAGRGEQQQEDTATQKLVLLSEPLLTAKLIMHA